MIIVTQIFSKCYRPLSLLFFFITAECSYSDIFHKVWRFHKVQPAVSLDVDLVVWMTPCNAYAGCRTFRPVIKISPSTR